MKASEHLTKAATNNYFNYLPFSFTNLSMEGQKKVKEWPSWVYHLQFVTVHDQIKTKKSSKLTLEKLLPENI